MEALNRLHTYLAKLADGGLCVAFSGGVDSAVLLKAACLAAPGKTHAVTLYTPFHSPLEPREAAALAAECGAPHTVVTLAEMPDAVMDNPPDRCYLCKRTVFEHVYAYAGQNRLAAVLDGTNADDLTQYRPGLRALEELGVRSPLAELGYSKTQVREMAAALGLAVASKPSAPCLATRFPYNCRIDAAALSLVEHIENAVKDRGMPVVRARVHGDTIRLEVPPADFQRVLQHREALLDTVREAGFARLTLDLAGYSSGSFDAPYRRKGGA